MMRLPIHKACWASLGLVLCFSQCTMSIGNFEDCQVTADCWETYAREDLTCSNQQCVVHELYKSCQTIVGDTHEDVMDYEMITFGAIMAMSTPEGASNPRGDFRSKALELGYGQFNQRLGADDQPFRVRVCDHQGDSEQVEALADYLVNERHVPLLITSGSQDTLNASVVTIASKTLLLSISATSPELRGLNDNGLVWCMSPSDALVGKAVADSIIVESEEAAPSIGIIYIDDVYGQGLQNEFKKRYQERYPSTSVNSYSFKTNDINSIDSALEHLKQDSVEKLFVIAFSEDGAYISNEVASIMSGVQPVSGANGLPLNCDLIYADSVKDEAFLEALDSTTPSRINGASIFSVGKLSGSIFENFQSQFQTTFDLDPSSQGYLAQAYDLSFLSALATYYSRQNHNEVTGERLAEALSHLSAGTPYTFEAANITDMINDLKNAGEINISGASGELDFDVSTGDPGGEISITYILNGGFTESESTPGICNSDE
jgi:hypothetical protein